MKTTKENIIKAAAKVFFTRGYEGATTKEIAETAGLANSSCLFAHFESKEDLYKKVIETYIINAQTPAQKFGDCENLSLYDFIDFYVQKVEKTMSFLHQTIQGKGKTAIQYFTFMLECAMKYEQSAKTMLIFNQEELDLWANIIQNARQTGEIRTNVNAKTLAEIFRYAFAGISYTLSIKGGVTVEELRNILYNIYDTVKTIK